jgi:predicted nucleotidyltransferase
MSSVNEWTVIQPKIKTKKNNRNHQKENGLSWSEFVQKITQVLSVYSPEAIFLYGSRARGTNRPDSDADIMVFWKASTIPSYERLVEIKQELIQNLSLNVDFVVMKLKAKFVEVHDLRTICYYDNVKIDAKCIYSPKNNIHISELIDFSEKQPKL